jgi:hypothetical protein
MMKWAGLAPYAALVLVVDGAPCQGVSGLNAGGLGLDDSRSGLIHEVPRIKELVRTAFPDARIEALGENVASMTQEVQNVYDSLAGVEGIEMCPSGCSWVRRPQLFWPSWDILDKELVQRLPSGRLTLKSKSPRIGVSKFMPKGWSLKSCHVKLPTFVRAIRRKRPPFQPAGLSGCDEATLGRWRKHNYMYPPYQFKSQYMMWKKGTAKPLTAESREVLLGFNKGHTWSCWRVGDRRARPAEHDEARCSLVGNSFHTGLVAYLLGDVLFQHGVLKQRPGVEIVANPLEYLKPQSSAVPLADVYDASLTTVAQLSHVFNNSQSHRGGEIKTLMGPTLNKPSEPQPVHPDLWKWKTVISTRWKQLGDHINVYEAQAAGLAVRWRAKDKNELNKRAVHLLDSQVSMSILAKGRTSSSRLLPVVRRFNAVLLAGHLHLLLGFVKSKQNPADRPSRQFQPRRGARLKAQKSNG